MFTIIEVAATRLNQVLEAAHDGKGGLATICPLQSPPSFYLPGSSGSVVTHRTLSATLPSKIQLQSLCAVTLSVGQATSQIGLLAGEISLGNPTTKLRFT